jgi:hypothetical protein
MAYGTDVDKSLGHLGEEVKEDEKEILKETGPASRKI